MVDFAPLIAGLCPGGQRALHWLVGLCLRLLLRLRVRLRLRMRLRLRGHMGALVDPHYGFHYRTGERVAFLRCPVGGTGDHRAKFAVALHLDGAFIILIKNCLLDRIALRLHEHFDIQCVRQVITRPDELGLGGALGVDFLLLGFAENASSTKGDDTSRVAAHVVVNGE